VEGNIATTGFLVNGGSTMQTQQAQEIRVSTSLTRAEYDALLSMATGELRHPRLQLRALVIAEARRRELLPAEDIDRVRQEIGHASR